jgi:hypothetical protein
MAVIGLARPQGWLAAVFYPFGHPTPYAHENETNGQTESPTTSATKVTRRSLTISKNIEIINLVVVDKGK